LVCSRGFKCRRLGPGLRVQEPDDETAEVRWVNPEEARTLIGQTENLPGRERDLKILETVATCRCNYDVSPCVQVNGLIAAPIQVEAGSEEEAYQLAHAALDLYSLEDFEKKFNTRWSFLDLDFKQPLYSTKLGDIRRLPVSLARKLVSNWQDVDGEPLEDHLNLTGLTEMPRELAETLAIHHEGSISFSPEIEAEFRKHVTLTADVLRQAVDFDEPPPFEDEGYRIKDLDTSWYWYIEDEAAELLALCTYADLKSVRELSDASAKALADTSTCAGLSLWSLEKLSEEGAKSIVAFASQGAYLDLGIGRLTKPVQSILQPEVDRQEQRERMRKLESERHSRIRQIWKRENAPSSGPVAAPRPWPRSWGVPPAPPAPTPPQPEE
jgi:hypothetical protein